MYAIRSYYEKLENQREVVKNERRQSYENRPYGLAFESVLDLAYPEGHPYRHPTIGYMEDIDAARLEDVHEFFDLHYGPNNATLVLVGDFEPEDALARIERWFGEIPARPVPPSRITSYNVCYTKLLRESDVPVAARTSAAVPSIRT